MAAVVTDVFARCVGEPDVQRREGGSKRHDEQKVRILSEDEREIEEAELVVNRVSGRRSRLCWSYSLRTLIAATPSPN